LETIFDPSYFDKDQPKSWNSSKRYLSSDKKGNFSSMTNSNLELTKNNFGIEYLGEDSTLELVEVDFKPFWLGIGTN
jgi:hypothetical protein